MNVSMWDASLSKRDVGSGARRCTGGNVSCESNVSARGWVGGARGLLAVSTLSVKELLESGAHFGHRTSRWNPKMERYLHGQRNRVHIIDVRKTVRHAVEAHHYLLTAARAGGQFLFVGTKRQARDAVIRETARTGMHQVTERWLGGTLTNLRTIREQVARLDELEAMAEDGRLQSHSKKMIASLNRERRRITRNLSGIRKMDRLPQALIVVDPRREHNALKEANKLGILTIALLDTDCDPDPIDIVIPCNDDSARAVDIVLAYLAEGILKGRGEAKLPTAGVAAPVAAEPAAKAASSSDKKEEAKAPDAAPAEEATKTDDAPAEAAAKPAPAADDAASAESGKSAD
jgi:small subunit ribosomal protein S2